MSFDPTRRPLWAVPAAVALVSAAVLATAYVSQYVFGLQPCTLCLWQRYPYMATIVLGLIGAAVSHRPTARRASVFLAAATFMAGAGMAGFHVGVEQGWWEGLPGCSMPAIDKDMSVADLRRALEARSEVVPCDEPAWTFFGISMAGYNALVSLLLAAGSLVALGRRWT